MLYFKSGMWDILRAEDREEWSEIVEQTKTHPGL
jgi:hypothetical protein